MMSRVRVTLSTRGNRLLKSMEGLALKKLPDGYEFWVHPEDMSIVVQLLDDKDILVYLIERIEARDERLKLSAVAESGYAGTA
jgi:ATP-dependent 26S proteasome regulatory subunit